MRSYWDAASRHPNVDREYICSAPLDECVAAVLDGLTLDGVVLEIGVGVGRIMGWLAERHPGVEFVGVDVSPEMLTIAKQRHGHLPNVRFVCTDGWTLPEVTVDAAYSVAVFQHCPAPVVEGYVKQVAARLQPGGRFRFQVVHETAPGPFQHAHDGPGLAVAAGLEVISTQVGVVEDCWTWVTARRSG